MLGWLTPDSIPLRVDCVVTLPNSEEWQAQFKGAFLLLTETRNWEKFGLLTPEETSDEWQAIFQEFLEGCKPVIPPGLVSPFAGSTLPSGWLWCDGSEISRTAYSDLFSAIGTTYGNGNGTTTFDLPLIQGRFIIGRDPGNTDYDNLGDVGGEATHTLTLAEMPIHSHVQNSGTVYAFSGGNLLAGGSNAVFGGPHTTANTGGSGGHNNLPPFFTQNFIIKV